MRAAAPATAVAILLAALVLSPCAARAQTTPTFGEKSVGSTDCKNSATAADFDTLAQCTSTSSSSGTMQKSPLFVGAVTSPPYTDTTCDSNKAGMIQYTASAMQYCNGSAWQTVGTGSTTGPGQSMISGWPDAIVCDVTSPNYGTEVYYAAYMPSSDGLYYYRRDYNGANGGGGVNSMVDGTAGAPGLYFENDTNTGLYRPAEDTLAIATNGTEKLRVDANGNVGIGTTTPGQKLTVAGMIESTASGIKFPDGTTQTTAASGGEPKAIRVYSTAGTHTYTPTAGAKAAIVEVIGGGGGGASDYGAAVYSGAAGGGGGYSKERISLEGVSSVTVTVGAGGTAGTGTCVAGGAGGTSSFGAYLSATGGGGGACNGNSGTSGAGSGGDINLSAGVNNSGTIYGSTAPFVGSVKGALGASGTPGSAGIYGGGGGGSYPGGYAQQNGGPGGAGLVIVTEY